MLKHCATDNLEAAATAAFSCLDEISVKILNRDESLKILDELFAIPLLAGGMQVNTAMRLGSVVGAGSRLIRVSVSAIFFAALGQVNCSSTSRPKARDASLIV
jgi:hypothetical protein